MAERVRHEVDGQFLAIRAVTVLVFASLLLVLPFDATTSERFVAAAATIGIGCVMTLVTRQLPAALRYLSANLFDALLIAAVASVIPTIWYAGVIVCATLAVGAIPVEPARNLVVQSVFAVSVMSLVGFVRDVSNWHLSIAAFAIMMVTINHFYRQWNLTRAETDNRYDTLVETAGLFFWELDPTTNRLVSITGNTQGSLDRGIDEVMAMRWTDLINDVGAFGDVMSALRSEPTGGIYAMFDLMHADGTVVPFRHRMQINLETGLVQGAAMEITELALATRLIRHQAEHDGLTGLITRNVFLTRLSALLDGCDASEPVAVLMVDLNRFKEVNDVLGHRVGDQLLTVLARRFEQLGFADVVARLGGDEFAFVLTGDNARRAVEHAEAVVVASEDLVQVQRLKLSVSASVGVALAPQDGTTTDVIMTRADTAMYRAKNANERVVEYAASTDARAGEHLALTAEIEAAIADGQVELWFQPKIDLATERVVGVEGLARWRHPDLGVLTPDRFLPLLTMSGLNEDFTDEVIRQGIEFAATTASEGAPISVAVNLSAMSFFDHGLAERVDAMLSHHSVDPAQLTFEITESDIVEDLTIHGPVFDRLTKLGIQLSIDDFGVGYSSLSRLRQLPVHELKIDRSFVMGMVQDPEDLIIVKAIVDLAAVLGHRSVAEGVETVEAWDRLREMGCDLAQGYFFGRPMPARELLATFAARDGVRRFVRDVAPS